METIRSFIALELSSEIQAELGRIQQELKKSDADVKWVEPSGIHLTLKFLGNVSLQLLDEIKKSLDQLAREHQGFTLEISQLGAFPTVEHPRVIWVGIEKGKLEIIKLVQDLEQGLINFGFLPEKRQPKPHLTLGRVRSSHNRNQLKELLCSLTPQSKVVSIQKIVLFQSTLTSQGAIYQALHQANLS